MHFRARLGVARDLAKGHDPTCGAAIDLELRDLIAERPPLQGRVVVERFATRRPMTDLLQDRRDGPVILSNADHRAPQVMSPPVPKPEGDEIVAEPFEREARGPHRIEAVAPLPRLPVRWKRHDQIVRPRWSAAHPCPPFQLPLGKDGRQCSVNGDAPVNAGLGRVPLVRASNCEAAKWLDGRVVVQPPKRDGFSVAQSTDPFECVEYAAVLIDAGIGDESLQLIAGVDGRCSPVRILVLRPAELRPRQDARAVAMQKVSDLGVPKQRLHEAVDVSDRLRREAIAPTEVREQIGDVSRADVLEREPADHWQDMITKATVLVADVDDPECATILDPPRFPLGNRNDAE